VIPFAISKQNLAVANCSLVLRGRMAERAFSNCKWLMATQPAKRVVAHQHFTLEFDCFHNLENLLTKLYFISEMDEM